MQAYLIEGICRWNANRRAASAQTPTTCYDLTAITALDTLSGQLLHRDLCRYSPKPAQFTGEFVVVAVLCLSIDILMHGRISLGKAC